jgi:hypothetical protein
MISGSSLGHTGGTLDKLETIPGFDTQLTLPHAEVLRDCHAVLVGQTPRLVPADRILYAMRDHTGTVESPFLICASIMSKKLAEDLNGLVLDVKVGSGAFMPTYEKSKFLAELMVSTGERSGTRTAALLTTMDEPLGRFSGNWVEVWECVDILQNKPISPEHPHVRGPDQLSNTLSGWMLYLAGKSATPEAGALLADELSAPAVPTSPGFRSSPPTTAIPPSSPIPRLFHKPAATSASSPPPATAIFPAMDCRKSAGPFSGSDAGRAVPGGPVSAHAGIESHAKLGDRLTAGQPIFTLFTEDRQNLRLGRLVLHVLLDALLPVQRGAGKGRTLAPRGAVLHRSGSRNGLRLGLHFHRRGHALGAEGARKLTVLKLHAFGSQALGGLHQRLALQGQLAGGGGAGGVRIKDVVLQQVGQPAVKQIDLRMNALQVVLAFSGVGHGISNVVRGLQVELPAGLQLRSWAGEG